MLVTDYVANGSFASLKKNVTLYQEPNYAYFPVVFEPETFGASRSEVFDKLGQNGIGARKYFYPLTNTFSAFGGKYDVSQTPVALHISKRVLTLPMYADLTLEEVDRICDIILSCQA